VEIGIFSEDIRARGEEVKTKGKRIFLAINWRENSYDSEV
jgi:hypothetical protein